MTNNNTQQSKAIQFHKLHHLGEMLVFPNIWDSLGAILLEELKYPAIATASASVAFTNGYKDGENIPFDYFLMLLNRIVNSVTIPVTADIESGYASDDTQFSENIKQLISTGIAGINIEDTDKKSNSLFSVKIQCDRIRSIKNISE
jgi:2-methylisocitrate lyase-like PEP mutase family enzyme